MVNHSLPGQNRTTGSDSQMITKGSSPEIHVKAANRKFDQAAGDPLRFPPVC
jgi:hypothetical protein